ncbi:MAG: tetratricopeptide repeat protein [Luteibaculaceae bacterium]
MKSLITLFFCFTISFVQAQTVEELFNSRDLDAIIVYAASDSLDKDDLFLVGGAYFEKQLYRDAIETFTKAIRSGLDTDYVYYYRGISSFYLDDHLNAISDLKKAIKAKPERQRNISQLGLVYLDKGNEKQAIKYFNKAREKSYEVSDPYVYLPAIYEEKGDFKNMKRELSKSVALIDKSDEYFSILSLRLGQQQLLDEKKSSKAEKTFTAVIQNQTTPQKYLYFRWLSAALIKQGKFDTSDSLFTILKREFEANNLPESIQENEGDIIDIFNWNDKSIYAFKSFVEPKAFADSYFKFYVYNTASEDLEMLILTEKTAAEIDEINHLLCGKNFLSNRRFTYPVGWSTTSEIEYAKLKNLVFEILNKNIQFAASSELPIMD